ncbi:DNA recombination protein RmuC [Sphingobium wenxiniae]|uniref:DNA recombination protein RmuC homolog n=2 Tax=Sphingobium TaxID=165695 RepID=A0A562KBX6_SPHWJ|nr:DNA recombination protein RmuC [Sphingobium wenxiniae]MBB6191575.1 DNA recombination protein RmuC [Sphingobium wenxiniae]TWH92824.1 DNA recombination protein RmuC [Sphingobium wenxiniae]
MDSLPILIAVIALLAGLGVGWMLRGKAVAALGAERADLAAKLEAASQQRNGAIAELAAAQERVAAAARLDAERVAQAAALEQRLDAAREARETAARQLAALQSDAQARAEAFEAQIVALKEAKEQLSAQFSEIGGKLLHQAQNQFLERADQRLTQAHEKSEAQLKSLLTPVETTLKRYEEGLARVEKERVGSYAELREAVQQVQLGQGQVREETAKLVNALRAAPKTRGRWGEQQFKNLIETAGLSPFVDFREEVSVAVEEGRLRPDFIIRLPGDQQLVVDVKCSLEAYLNAVEQVDPAARDRYMTDHARAVRTHADALGRKAYWEQFDKAPDFVIMYVPGDNFVTAALEADMELWERAAKNRVIICGPATFLPLARTLAGHWRQARMQDQARQVGQLGKELYERLAVAAGHLKRVGSGLTSAVDNYNKFVGSFDRSVLPAGRRFRDLDVETGGKEIEAVEPLEALVRDSQAEESIRALPDAAE